MTRPTEPCPFYGMPCEHVPMAHEAVRLKAEVDSLRAAEAREKVLREALATIHEAAFTHKGYPTPQSELVEAAARRALGGEP